jgi:hypothetical protein
MRCARAVAGHQHDRHEPRAFHLLQTRADLEAVEAGETHVEQHDVDVAPLHERKRLLAVRRGLHVIIRAEQTAQEPSIGLLVIHDQYASSAV